MQRPTKETLCTVFKGEIKLPRSIELEGRISAALCGEELIIFPQRRFLHIELYQQAPPNMAYKSAQIKKREKNAFLTLSESQLRHTGITEDALLVRMLDHYELWQPDRYEIYSQAKEAESILANYG